MRSRSVYDYSLWPEHARPRRRRLSFRTILTSLAVLAVSAFAARVVYSELVPPPETQQLQGRTWPLQTAVDQRQARVPQQAGAADAEPAKAKPARVPVPVNSTTRRVMLPTIGTSQELAGSETDGRATEPAKPAVTEPPRLPISEPEVSTAASEPKAAAPERPAKPHRKIVRRSRTNAAVAYRRNGPEATPGYYGGGYAGGYGGYSSPGGYRPWQPYYADRSNTYRPY